MEIRAGTGVVEEKGDGYERLSGRGIWYVMNVYGRFEIIVFKRTSNDIMKTLRTH